MISRATGRTGFVYVAGAVLALAWSGCAVSMDTGDGNGGGDGSPPSDSRGGDSGSRDVPLGTDTGNGSDASDTTDDLPGMTDTVDVADTGVTMCPGGGASITGHAYAPNRTDPIPHVAVYVTDDSATFPPGPSMVTCDHCVSFAGSLAGAISGTDGSFTIMNPSLDAGGTFTIVFVSGGFRHVLRHVTIPPCGTVMLTAAQTAFSGASSGDDIIPRIAVAGFDPPTSGSSGGDVNDHFVTVLHAIGITAFDTFDPDRTGAPHTAGTTNDIINLLNTPSRLNQYQVVILPCGVLGNFAVGTSLTATMVTNLQAWMQAGGRLYASDLSYDVINRAFAAGLNWAPGPSPHTGADPASCGVGISGTATLPATVDDPDLASWLNLVAHTTGTSIAISELRDPWGAVDSIPAGELSSTPAHAHSWVSGNVSWHTGATGTVGPAHHPLTVQADYPGSDMRYCGRVVFSSYHVQSTTTPTTLSPQERVLEYLFFQLTQCIGNLTSM